MTHLPRELNSDLILRFATPGDAESVAAFNQKIHGEHPDDTRIQTWTRDLILGKNPNVQAGDCTLVEDRQTGKIVSTMLLIPQTWSYEGIPIPVGRPELVATDPDFRNRGLVRAQFEALHQLSESRGDLVQGITGIPYYYRKFGYEMAVNLDVNRKGYAPQQLPVLKEGESEPYLFRASQKGDLNFIKQCVDQGNKRSLLSCIRDINLWEYELNGHSEDSVSRQNFYTITDTENRPVGVLLTPNFLWDTGMFALVFEVAPGISWHAVTPSVLRFLWKIGQETRSYANKTCNSVGLALGTEHPAYEAAGKSLSDIKRPYAWYIRVPDLAAFMMKITPVLEKRIKESSFVNITKELKIGFYRNGLKIQIEQGKIITVENWKPPYWDKVDAAFPDLTLLQMIFGHRNYSELAYAFPDCWAKDTEISQLLDTLFPKKASDIFPLS